LVLKFHFLPVRLAMFLFQKVIFIKVYLRVNYNVFFKTNTKS